MKGRRVVITGVGIASPIGNDLSTASQALREGRHGIVAKSEWDSVADLHTRLAAEVRGIDAAAWPRKKVRSMGRVSHLATYATEQAVADAGLTSDEIQSGDVGLSFGSTHGSSTELERFCKTLFANEGLTGLSGSAYLKFMSHTCAANLAQFYGVRGRVIASCTACTSGSQAIGFGYEAVKFGLQEAMICGGSEELHFLHAGVFDILYATSTRYNDNPAASPRPFDAERDGLVVGEGAGAFVLESLDRATARGAQVYAEVVGFGTNCDGTHVTAPSVDGMASAMELALKDAAVNAGDIDYLNAHATATKVGDICESRATHRVLGDQIAISSTKGFTGHTLGGCGAIEAGFCIAMMRDGFVAPSRNLEQLDPECAPLAYVRNDARDARVNICMSNNFAFGGINTSLVFRKV